MEALKKNRDFQLVFKKGKKTFSKSLVFYYLNDKSKDLKIGIAVSKAIKTKPRINLIKRQIRSILQNLNFKKTGKIVIFAKTKFEVMSFKEKEKDLRLFFNK